MICHLYGASGVLHGSLFGAVILQSLGELVVAVFFFLSGYGLMYSYRIKKDNYLESFIEKRILPFYVIILYLTVGYAIFHIMLNNKITIGMILKGLTFGGGIISNGWYLQVQMLLYVFFILICKRVQSSQMQLGFFVLSEILYCMVIMYCGLPTYWYQTVLTFAFGIVWAVYKEKIDSYLNESVKRRGLLLIGTFLLFSSLFLGQYQVEDFVIKKMFRIIANIFFAGL